MRGAIFVALCVVCSSTTMAQDIFSRLFGGYGDDGWEMERQYRVVKGRKLGALLAGKFPGKKALIFLPPEPVTMPGVEYVGEFPHVAVLEGLKAELKGTEIVGMIEPKLPAAVKAKMRAAMGDGGGEMMTLEEHVWFGVKELNKELEAYKGKYDVLICLAPLPGVEAMGMGMGGKKMLSYTRLSVWHEKGVSVAIAEGDVWKLRRKIESGAICAAVSSKRRMRDADYEKKPAKDLDDAFSTRFVLITPENLAKHRAYFSTRCYR